MLKWYEKNGKPDDVVLSSRIRLARNFNGYMFADRLSDEDGTQLVNSVISNFKNDYPEDYSCIFMNNCSDTKRNALKEQRKINSYLAGGRKGAVLLSGDEGTSIMLNSEDHVRIQVLAPGMNIPVCFKRANDIDDYIDAHFDYAYDERYGYKTTYPTNVGTGMRAGYTLHLPALTDAKRINQISTELARFGVKFKSLYGDDEGSYGAIYQVASQKTLGQEEKEIIKDLDDITAQLITQEREQRKYFYDNATIQIEDEIYKSYGVLRYARKLSLRDAMTLMSEVMLGKALGLFTFDKGERYSFNKLIIDIQPAVLASRSRKGLSVEEADTARAQYVREHIPDIL